MTESINDDDCILIANACEQRSLLLHGRNTDNCYCGEIMRITKLVGKTEVPENRVPVLRGLAGPHALIIFKALEVINKTKRGKVV